MSKIGKLPVQIVEGVTVVIENGEVKANGTKGAMSFKIPTGIEVNMEEDKVIVSQKKGMEEETKALFGLTRAMVSNIVTGVSKGFEKKLELTGVGYRAQASGNTLTLSLGFSHPVIFKAPEGVTFTVVENVITVAGMDKVIIGDIAAKVRAVRPPEPYKGKGIKYVGERIRRKAGKAAKAVGK